MAVGAEFFGVVSMLDQRHESLVAALWAQLERGLSFSETHLPHFTYHSAERYDLKQIERNLRGRSAMRRPFQVKGTGMLGVAHAPSAPCFFLPLVRNGDLDQMHRELWSELPEIAEGIVDWYAPGNWLPTIALTPDIEEDVSSRLLQRMLERQWAWEIRIDNLSLLHDTGTRQELVYRLDLGDGPG